jgi:hypothetical protein
MPTVCVIFFNLVFFFDSLDLITSEHKRLSLPPGSMSAG